MIKKLAALVVLATAMLAAPAAAREYTVELTYAAPAAPVMGEPLIAIGEVTSGRQNPSPHDLGAIRGGYGNRLKDLVTAQPVLDVVAGAVRQGLEARGLLAASSPRYRMDLRLVKFDCSQYQRREAHFHLMVSLFDVASGEMVYGKTTEVAHVDGSMMSLATGIFAKVDDLRNTANTAMQMGIDQALDDPGLREALARPAAAVAAVETVPAAAEAAPAADAAPPPVPAPATTQ